MADLFATGRIVDLILLLVLFEFLALALFARRRVAHLSVRDFIFTLASGACLLAALRAALSGASWIWIAAFLAASLAAHLGDLWNLLRR